MIRALTLSALAALPATAQDFRGLRPGMDASALGPIGEPERIVREGDYTAGYYPLPFGQRLTVVYNVEGDIVWLSSYALPNAPTAPDTGGLHVGRMKLSDVEQLLGRQAAALDEPGLVLRTPGGFGFRLVYDHPETEEVLVALEFLGAIVPSDDALAVPPLPRGARLIAADLFHRDHFEALDGYDAFLGGPRTSPIPFPLPIDEAFPSLIP